LWRCGLCTGEEAKDLRKGKKEIVVFVGEMEVLSNWC
jgi:hypothetical protein